MDKPPNELRREPEDASGPDQLSFAASAIDLGREEYKSLREEIKQSIDKQHQILIAGYSAAGLTCGYGLGTGKDPASLLAVPLILFAMACLWMVEVNRMVRASHYIAYRLWPELRRLTGSHPSVDWETWIRTPHLVCGDDDYVNHGDDFRKRQARMQLAVSVLIPAMASLLCIAFVWGARGDRPFSIGFAGLSLTFSPWILVATVVMLLWIALGFDAALVSNLAIHSRDLTTRKVLPKVGPVATAPSEAEPREPQKASQV